MKIGLDFDGVISNCGKLKNEGGKKLYGIDIPPEKFKKELIVNAGILTLNQYNFLQQQVYCTRDIGLKMVPVEGVLEFIPKLKKTNHDLIIITSRGGIASDIAQEWLKMNNLYLPLVGVNGKSKAEACKGLDVYIDDDLDKLEQVVDSVQHRYLFSWGYNQHMKVPNEIGQRIFSWQHFYDEVSRLNKL